MSPVWVCLPKAREPSFRKTQLGEDSQCFLPPGSSYQQRSQSGQRQRGPAGPRLTSERGSEGLAGAAGNALSGSSPSPEKTSRLHLTGQQH